MSTLVLLRGLMREARHWGDFPQLLGEAVPQARVHAIDLPGNGRLYREPSPTRVAQMMECCRASLRELGAVPPYHLVALSLGGMVAVHWAHAYPEEVAATALLSTSMRPFSPFYRRLRPANYPAAISMLLGRRDPCIDERVILHITSSHTEAQVPRTLRAWIEYARECPVSRTNALRQLWAAARFSAARQAPAGGRVLLLAGARDRLVHPDCSAALARAWGAPLALHPAAGHDLPLDDGPWVAAQLRDWLGTLQADAAPTPRSPTQTLREPA
jgi:pimeloyl-ACP methyl ester carboxylesterase